MTQANDLGQIANQARTLYRGRVNAGFQAVATFHDGASAPSPTYPNMLWFDTGTGLVKQRDPSNTAWNTLGTIGPPFRWTCVDVPPSELTTGDLKLTLKTVADAGWVMMNDGSIGDASSNATARAFADCQALFTLLWTNISNSWAPIQDSSGSPVSRGASAAADWTAHRRLVLPRTLGRALAIAGSGSGLTSRALGEVLGEETHTLTGPEMAHNHPITGTNRAQGPAGGVSTFNSPTGAVSNVTASAQHHAAGLVSQRDGEAVTQSSNLGAVPTGTGATVRAAFNTGFQVVTESEGTGAPSPTYPFMLWRNDTTKLIKRRNAANSAWEMVANYGATADPTVNDDTTDGWVRGSLWINTTGNKLFVCSNPADGAAAWKDLGAAAGTQAFGTISVSGQSDVVADAAPDTLTLVGSSGITITTTPGTDTVTFVPSYGSSANTVCQGNDARLSDARTPTAHATSHKSGGADAIKLDELAAPTDVTTLNASTSAHGLMPKGDGNATHFYNGALNQVAPPYDILVGIAGKPSNGEVVLLFVAPRAFRILANPAART